MPASLALLTVTRNPAAHLADLVAAWDAQTVEADRARLLVVEDGSDDGSAERLHELARRRPDVEVVDAHGDAAGALLRAVRESGAGHVGLLAQDRRLAPRAVELLLRALDRTGAEVVVGRTAEVSESGSRALPDDAADLGPDRRSAALEHGVVLLPRELVMAQADPVAALREPQTWLPEGTRVAGVGSCAVALGPGAPARGAGTRATTELAWRNGALHLGVPLDGTAGSGSEGSAAWLVLTSADRGSEHTLALDLAGGTSAPVAVLDPAAASSGDALPEGVWEVALRVASADGEETFALTPPAGSGNAPRSVVVDGRLHVATSTGHGLQLDVGGTRTSATGRVRPEDAAVVETARGSVLTVRLPGVAAADEVDLPAQVRIGDLLLPARLRGDGSSDHGAARIEAYATGLAGPAPLALATGGARPQPTGLRLVVDEVGGMSVEVEPPAPKPAPKPAPQPKAAAAKAAPAPKTAPAPRPAPSAPRRRPLVQRVRRHAPAGLEPLVKRLAKVPVLADGYRRLLRR